MPCAQLSLAPDLWIAVHISDLYQWQLKLDNSVRLTENQTANRPDFWWEHLMVRHLLLVWLHHDTPSPRTVVSMLSSPQQALDQSWTGPVSLLPQTARCFVQFAACAVNATTGTLNTSAWNDPKHLPALTMTEQTWTNQMQTMSLNGKEGWASAELGAKDKTSESCARLESADRLKRSTSLEAFLWIFNWRCHSVNSPKSC